MYSKRVISLWNTEYSKDDLKEDQETPLDVITEYLNGSSIHGMKYIGRRGGNMWGSLFWLVSIIVCSAFGGTFVSFVWESFETSPTATSVANTHYPLYKLPFPAITMCSANRIKKAVGMNLFKKFLSIKQLNSSFERKLWNIMNLISLTEYPFYYRIARYYNETMDIHQMFDDFNITSFILEAMPTCDDIFHSCYWRGVPYNCCDLLTLQRSEMGFCYSFNSLTSEKNIQCPAWQEVDPDVTQDDILRNHVPEECVLKRNMGSGRTTGFEVLLKETKLENHMWIGTQDDKGCKIFVHHPSDYPEPSKSFFFQEKSDQIFAVWVTASLTISASAVKTLSVEERQCYFPNEYSLSIFRIYTEKNCYVECRLKHIAEKCNCIPYFFNNVHLNVSICKISELTCLSDVDLEIRSFKPPPNIPGFTYSGQLNCSHCLPLCHQTVYSTHSSTINNYNEQFSAAGYMDVFYEDNTAIKYFKNVAFGRMDLIVAFGGIIGLFLGMSLLSFVEMFYYFIRLVISCWMYMQRKKYSQRIDLQNQNMSSNQHNNIKVQQVGPFKLYY